MNKTVMNKWTAALRSGKYAQCTSGYLKVSKARRNLAAAKLQGNSSYCVLGVLCELYQLEHPGATLSESLDERLPGKLVTNYDGRIDDEVPEKVLEWAEMRQWTVSGRGEEKSPVVLTQLNDLGYTFLNLSQIISTHYKVL